MISTKPDEVLSELIETSARVVATLEKDYRIRESDVGILVTLNERLVEELSALRKQLAESQADNNTARWGMERMLDALESLNRTGRWPFGAFEEMARAREYLGQDKPGYAKVPPREIDQLVTENQRLRALLAKRPRLTGLHYEHHYQIECSCNGCKIKAYDAEIGAELGEK